MKVEYNKETHELRETTNIFGDKIIAVIAKKRHCSSCSREFKPWNRFYIIDDVEATIRQKKIVTTKNESVVCKHCRDPKYREFVKSILG